MVSPRAEDLCLHRPPPSGGPKDAPPQPPPPRASHTNMPPPSPRQRANSRPQRVMPPSVEQGGKPPPPHLVRAKADGSMPRLPSHDDFGRTLDCTRATREPDGQAVQIPVARIKAFPGKRVNSRDKSRSRDAHRTVRSVERRSPMSLRAPPMPHRYADPLWASSVEKGKAAGRAPI